MTSGSGLRGAPKPPAVAGGVFVKITERCMCCIALYIGIGRERFALFCLLKRSPKTVTAKVGSAGKKIMSKQKYRQETKKAKKKKHP
jgi:hypothetical protein